jgi:adenosylcobinamide-GDP ribazoletransferase
MRKALNRFLSVFALVSRIPLPLKSPPDYSRADLFLPCVGILAALVAWCGARAGFSLFSGDPLLSALAALVLQYFAFNLFHLDGLLDSADALLPLASRERRLEILKDPRIGSYGFAAGFFSLAAKVALVLYIIKNYGLTGPGAIAAFGYPVAGRIACALVPLAIRPAKPDGLGSLLRGLKLRYLALGALLSLCPFALPATLAGAWRELAGLGMSAVLAAMLGGGLVASAYTRKAGGFTGDALGAAVESGELAYLAAFVGFRSLVPA